MVKRIEFMLPVDCADAIVSVKGLNRDHLIETLETLLAHLRVAPDFVNLATCDGNKGRIEVANSNERGSL